MPASVQGQLPGHGAGVPELDCRTWVCCSLIAIITVYIILGILYESFIHPLTILSGLPSRGGGRADRPCGCSAFRSASTPLSA